MHKTRKSHSFMQAFNPKGSHLLSKVNKRIGCSLIRATQSSPKQNTTTALMRNQTTRKKRCRGRISRRQIILLRKWREGREAAWVFSARVSSQLRLTSMAPELIFFTYLLWLMSPGDVQKEKEDKYQALSPSHLPALAGCGRRHISWLTCLK